MTPMDDVEAVAMAIKREAIMSEGSYPNIILDNPEDCAQAAIETLKSRGWTPPSEGKM